MSREAQSRIFKFKGIKSDIFSAEDRSEELGGKRCSGEDRQHHRHGEYAKARFDKITEIDKNYEKNILDNTKASDSLTGRAHQGRRESVGGSIESDGQVRLAIEFEAIPCNQQTLGTTIDGFIRDKNKSADKAILLDGGRSLRFSKPVEQEGELGVSAASSNSKDYSENKGRENLGGVADPKLAEQGMVSGSQEHVTIDTSFFTAQEAHLQGSVQLDKPRNVGCSRLETLRIGLRKLELEDDTLALMLEAEKSKTRANYESSWKAFTEYCCLDGVDASEYNPKTAINYLAKLAKENRPLGTINLHRTAISTTWRLLHPERPAFGETASQTRLLKGLSSRQSRPIKTPIWDTNRITSYFVESRKELDHLKISDLAARTALLISLATGWRAGSDLARISMEKSTFNEEYIVY